MMSIIAAPPLAPAPSQGWGLRDDQRGEGGPRGVQALWGAASGQGPHPVLQSKVLPVITTMPGTSWGCLDPMAWCLQSILVSMSGKRL